ncbi:MAG: hypothetical protein FJ041_07280 [Candidatus Cloacimonetes bacterium]|nr:hypothetical protein [Candidatus Cloacimonadota bacterium]
MVKKIILFLPIIFLLAGCSYSVYSNAYPHLKRIQILAFENNSTEFALGDIVFNKVSDLFRDDGRLRTVTQQPDCQLEGKIISYSERIYSYDAANNVQDYFITVTFSVVFTDLVQNEVLMDNKNLTLTELYAVSTESTSRFQSKDEALNEICDKLFKTIMQSTLESW